MDKVNLLSTDTTSNAIHGADPIVKEVLNDGTPEEMSEQSGQYVNVEHINEAKRKKRKIKIEKLKERIKKKKQKSKAHKHKLPEAKCSDREDPDGSLQTLLSDGNDSMDEEDPLHSQIRQGDLSDDNQAENQTGESCVRDRNYLLNDSNHIEKSNEVRTNYFKQQPEAEVNVEKLERTDFTPYDPSFNNKNSSDHKAAKVLTLCRRGDWTVLEQILRNPRRDSHFAQGQDQVSHTILVHMLIHVPVLAKDLIMNMLFKCNSVC